MRNAYVLPCQVKAEGTLYGSLPIINSTNHSKSHDLCLISY